MYTPDAEGEPIAPLVRLIADRARDPARHKTRICLLIGAGADISSGGLTFAELKRFAIEDFLREPLFDITSSADIDARFESVFLRLEPDERALLIEALFQRLAPLVPSDAYKLLILLAEAGGIDAVITTNFDVLLERAQALLGRDLFQVFAPGVARPYPMTADRFDLPKKPYLKLHGDIASRTVTLLTSDELNRSVYDRSMLDLLQSILRNHDLVIAGYSGYDPALASVIADAVLSANSRIYWCNPHPPSASSPLLARIKDRTRYFKIGFDQLISELSRPVLERPSLAATEPTYVSCLFDWRVDYCNREYVQTYGQRSGRSIVDTFVRRRTVEQRISTFLKQEHALAIITGPSGFGKTTIGLRLLKTLRNDRHRRVLLARGRTLPESGDVELFVSEQLGGLGSRTPFSLFRLEKWLKENNRRLILYVDGINEFSPDLSRCVQLFRNLLRLCYFLPEIDSAIRVIATVRQETWNAMLPHLDATQLHKVAWSEDPTQQGFSTIPCEALTDDELTDALRQVRDYGLDELFVQSLSPVSYEMLRDPYVLRTISESARRGTRPAVGPKLYQQAFDARLQQHSLVVSSATLVEILSGLALRCLELQNDFFREIDIHPAALRVEVVRLLKDANILVDGSSGFLQFDHERTFEYFLAVALGAGAGPRLDTTADVAEFLRRFRNNSKGIAAARLHFQLTTETSFSIISSALRTLDTDPSGDSEMLFGFARDVLLEMVDHRNAIATSYLRDAVSAARSGAIGAHHLRTVIQCAATLPVEQALPLLADISHPSAQLAGTEANIYAIDKLLKRYLSDKCVATSLLTDSPYTEYFGDRRLPAWRRLGRVLSLAAQFGSDNTHPTEYAKGSELLADALGTLAEERWDEQSCRDFIRMFMASCDRLCFNATPQLISRFFGNGQRHAFAEVARKLGSGAVLTHADFLRFEPYTQSLTNHVEYMLTHVLFILSSLSDLDGTLAFAEQQFATFSNNTPPEEIDFFQAVLVYLHILHGLDYDKRRFGAWEETIFERWPNVLLYRPGEERGERRGFRDPFDKIFEDGFGVVYAYGVLAPGIRRRSMLYADYKKTPPADPGVPLPLYRKALERFLEEDRVEEALQTLQAISGVVVEWPTEGLTTIAGVIGHADAKIRRATTRILAEAFHRHPDETMAFLRSSGVAVNSEELIEIKIRRDANIGRRQISEQQWARIGQLLFKRSGAREVLIRCIEAIAHSSSVDAAIGRVLQELGLIGRAAT